MVPYKNQDYSINMDRPILSRPNADLVTFQGDRPNSPVIGQECIDELADFASPFGRRGT